MIQVSYTYLHPTPCFHKHSTQVSPVRLEFVEQTMSGFLFAFKDIELLPEHKVFENQALFRLE